MREGGVGCDDLGFGAGEDWRAIQATCDLHDPILFLGGCRAAPDIVGDDSGGRSSSSSGSATSYLRRECT